jgi:hypothetical protein
MAAHPLTTKVLRSHVPKLAKSYRRVSPFLGVIGGKYGKAEADAKDRLTRRALYCIRAKRVFVGIFARTATILTTPRIVVAAQTSKAHEIYLAIL